MQNSCQTAGQTAKRTLVIFRDCHSKNNIVVEANSDREEEKIRLRAMSKGYLVAVRKPRELTQNLDNTCTSSTKTWRKPLSASKRPRVQLGGAFCLTLYPMAKEGGAV